MKFCVKSWCRKRLEVMWWSKSSSRGFNSLIARAYIRCITSPSSPCSMLHPSTSQASNLTTSNISLSHSIPTTRNRPYTQPSRIIKAKVSKLLHRKTPVLLTLSFPRFPKVPQCRASINQAPSSTTRFCNHLFPSNSKSQPLVNPSTTMRNLSKCKAALGTIVTAG